MKKFTKLRIKGIVENHFIKSSYENVSIADLFVSSSIWL